MAEVIVRDAVLVPVDMLKPHPRNPRQGDVGAVYESIRENGFYAPLVVQSSTGYILAGNHRWQAARQAGLEEVPVCWVDVDDDRALRILLVDNRANDLADYNTAALLDLLQELDSLDGTGYDGDAMDELADLLAEKPKRSPVDTGRAPRVTEPGDVWLLGLAGHELHAGLGDLDEVDALVRSWQTETGGEATLQGDGRPFDVIAAERLEG